MRHLKATIAIAHPYDFQRALESWVPKMNIQKPSKNLFDHELDYPEFIVFPDGKDLVTCGYPNSKGVKTRMYLHQVALFSNGTLKTVLKELKKKIHLHKMTFSIMESQEHFLVKQFFKANEERIRIREDLRIVGIMFKLRRKHPNISTT